MFFGKEPLPFLLTLSEPREENLHFRPFPEREKNTRDFMLTGLLFAKKNKKHNVFQSLNLTLFAAISQVISMIQLLIDQ